MKVCYLPNLKLFRKTRDTIDSINAILDEYAGQGFRLTVRQLYYQLVARGMIANTMLQYKWIARIVNDGRLCGLIDWDMIEDRTRSFKGQTRWLSGAHILKAAANSFHMDMWENQDTRVFIIIEKEALFGVFERVCLEFDIPLLAARGYPSVSVLRDFAINDVVPSAQDVVILHFGDHDPSGIDMTRDLQDRISLFNDAHQGPDLNLIRCALNMDQVKAKKPPKNPAKLTDSRIGKYMKRFGSSSWELDALEPAYLENIVRKRVTPLINQAAWKRRRAEVEDIRSRIVTVSTKFK